MIVEYLLNHKRKLLSYSLMNSYVTKMRITIVQRHTNSNKLSFVDYMMPYQSIYDGFSIEVLLLSFQL